MNSNNSFFSRNIPHTQRVRHIKGLNDKPVCSVNDEGIYPSLRYCLGKPTSTERHLLFQYKLPACLLGINSTLYPIDTITGLQNFPIKEMDFPPQKLQKELVLNMIRATVASELLYQQKHAEEKRLLTAVLENGVATSRERFKSMKDSVSDQTAGPRLNNGKLYKYSYAAEVLLDRAKGTAEESTGYRISTSVNVNLVWRNPSNKDEQLIKILMSDVKIENVNKRDDKRNIFLGSSAKSILGKDNLAALEKPLILHLNFGKVKSLYSYQKEHAVITNIKRGLVSLFQLQLSSGRGEEEDVSGKCKVNYQSRQNQVTRIKELDSCKTADTGFTSHSKVLGVSSKSTSATVFTLEGGFIKSAHSEENHLLSLNVRQAIAAKIVSKQMLQLVKIEAGPKETAGKEVKSIIKTLDPKYVSIPLAAETVKSECKGCPTSVSKEFEPKSLSNSTAARKFLSLIRTMRKARKEEILQVLRSASSSVLPPLVDAVTSTQTLASLEAILEFLDFSDEEGLVLQERFLYACGFASHPNEEMLKAMMGIRNGKISSNDIKESVVIIMGALVRKLCQKGGCELPAVVETKKLILEGPDSTEVESEIKMYLLALKNALLPEAVPLLTKYSESGSGPISSISIAALRKYDVSLITEEVKKTLNRIYHQNYRVHEKTVRTAAADLIFSSNPTYMEVKNLMLSIGSLPHEMNKYMLSKVQDILHFEMPASSRQFILPRVSPNLTATTPALTRERRRRTHAVL
ncbi:UNVERIFIED_CONTAM: hypothetical protein FKN15_070013 [Acipenser sinensis]